MATTHIRYLLLSTGIVVTPFFFSCVDAIFSSLHMALYLLLRNFWRLMGQFFSNYTEMITEMP